MEKKDTDALVWGTLREKGFLRDMVKKRSGTERIEFLLQYRRALRHRKVWGTINKMAITAYADRLIRDCKHREGGVNCDNTGL